MLYLLVHHGYSSGLLGTHPTTIHYTPPMSPRNAVPLISEAIGIELGNPPKPALIRIPRVTPGLVKGQDADQ
jgi:hypothetical protein